MGHIAAAHWGHDSSITFYNSHTKKIHIIEIAKVSGNKHHRGHVRRDEEIETLQKCLEIAENDFGVENDFDVFIIGVPEPHKRRKIGNPTVEDYQDLTPDDIDTYGLDTCLVPANVKKVFNVKRIEVAERHHVGHALCGYIQSPFEKCVVLTMDGGGDDGRCGLFTVDKNQLVSIFKKNPDKDFLPQLIYNYNFAALALMYDINQTTAQPLDVAGKTMGASAYGKKDTKSFNLGRQVLRNITTGRLKNLIPEFYKMAFSYSKDGGYTRHFLQRKHYISPEAQPWYREVKKPEDVTWQDQCDYALGMQLELEEQAVRLVDNFQGLIKEYGNNLIISGGGALNVLMNARIQKETNYNVWIPPNADDSGLSLGFLIEYMVKNNIDVGKQDLTYSGPKITDRDQFLHYALKYRHKKTNLKEISDLLKEDKIIGLVQGNGEIGPRALGNRSILADPKGEDKKDKVNLVKRREKYRPFAPVCRKEDAPKYFKLRRSFNLFHMNIAVQTRDNRLDDVRAATHVDGTARLQIVTKQSNELLYDLLTEFDGVLLNTSFNVQGKPILNSYAEAFEVLDNTLLDHVVIEHEGELYLF